MRWPAIIRAIKAAIEGDPDGVAILGAEDAQAAYLSGSASRYYEIPSLDIQFVTRSKEEVTEPLFLQFNGHGATLDDVIDIGHMLERLFDKDTWVTIGGIYMWCARREDGPLDGPDSNGRFHQSWDYVFDPVRSRYVNEAVES